MATNTASLPRLARAATARASQADHAVAPHSARRGASDGMRSRMRWTLVAVCAATIVLMLWGIAQVAHTQVRRGQAFEYAAQPAASADVRVAASGDLPRAEGAHAAVGLTPVSYRR